MITYRDAVPSDAVVLERIFTEVFCDTFAHLYRKDDLEAFLSSFSTADWKAQLESPDYAFRIAEIEGRGIAYVKLGPLSKLPVQTDVPAMILDQLYVLKDYHGSGIGRELMEWAMRASRLRGAQDLFLTVYVDNHRARRLYDRLGFEPVGRYDFMVGSHADEDIIMRKHL
jgi:GNAT superfamily N-acetyltransferase